MENNNSQDSQMNPLQNEPTTTTSVPEETSTYVRVDDSAAAETRQQPPVEAPAAPAMEAPAEAPADKAPEEVAEAPAEAAAPAMEAPAEAPANADPHGFQPIHLDLQGDTASTTEAPASAYSDSTRVHPVTQPSQEAPAAPQAPTQAAPQQPMQAAPQAPAGMPASEYTRVGAAYNPNNVDVVHSEYSRVDTPAAPQAPTSAPGMAAGAAMGSAYTRVDQAAPQQSAPSMPPQQPATPQAGAAPQPGTGAGGGFTPGGTVPPTGGQGAGPAGAAGAPTGKTKRKKHGGFGKALAILLIGAIVGGATGGVVGYQLSDNHKPAVVAGDSHKNGDEKNITYDSEGNMSVTSIAAEAMPAVVSVYNMTNANRSLDSIFGGDQAGNKGDSVAQGYGSGVIISDDGMIVTNYHVIEDSDSVVVRTDDDKEYKAKVLGTDSIMDLAVLKIDASDLPYIDIADSDQVQVGDLAVAIGNPLGSQFANTVTNGVVSGVDRKISSENGDLGLLQTNASINSGNSGGALLNGQAQLIGINSMKIQSNGMAAVEGMGFAIPSNNVLEFVNSVKDGSHTKNSTKKAWLGITGYSMNETLARQLGVDQNTGILIASLNEGGPAEASGLQIGDILTAVDDKKIETFEDLSGYLAEKQPNDVVEFTVIREDETGKVKVTLGSQN